MAAEGDIREGESIATKDDKMAAKNNKMAAEGDKMAAESDKMASKGDCPSCFGKLAEPKLLECLHAVCEDCLAELSRDGDFACPVCGAQTREQKFEAWVKDLFTRVEKDEVLQILQQEFGTDRAGRGRRQAEDARQEDKTDETASMPQQAAPALDTPQQAATAPDTPPEVEDGVSCELCDFHAPAHFCFTCEKLLCEGCRRGHTKMSTCRVENSGTLAVLAPQYRQALDEAARSLDLTAHRLAQVKDATRAQYVECKSNAEAVLQVSELELVRVIKAHFTAHHELLNTEFSRRLQEVTERCEAVRAGLLDEQERVSALSTQGTTGLVKQYVALAKQVRGKLTEAQELALPAFKVEVVNGTRNTASFKRAEATNLIIAGTVTVGGRPGAGSQGGRPGAGPQGGWPGVSQQEVEVRTKTPEPRVVEQRRESGATWLCPRCSFKHTSANKYCVYCMAPVDDAAVTQWDTAE